MSLFHQSARLSTLKKQAKIGIFLKKENGGHTLQKTMSSLRLSSHRRFKETRGERGVIRLEKGRDVVYGCSLI